MKTEAWTVRAHGQAAPERETVNLEEPSDNEALVRIVATGICGTDVHALHGAFPTPAGVILGHEGGGVVEAVGKNVTHVKRGDKVICSFRYCEVCGPCKRGKVSWCESNVNFYFSCERDAEQAHAATAEDGFKLSGGFFGQSSFARYALVHRSSLNKVPDDTDLHVHAAIGCGIMTGAGAVLNVLNPEPASGSFAVYGAGGVGLSALMAAKHLKLSPIIAVDVDDSRLALAKELGATVTVNSAGKEPEQITAAVREATGGLGVEYTVDSSGVPPVIRAAFDSAATLGTVVIVGTAGPGSDASLGTFSTVVRGLQVKGCCMGGGVPSEFIPRLISLSKQGEFPIAKILTIFSGADFAGALTAMKGGKVIKPIVLFD